MNLVAGAAILENTERWLSGLKHVFAKDAWGNSHRGFESRPLRLIVTPNLPPHPRRHFSEQYTTRSQSRAHFLRHANGRPQRGQTLLGNCDFSTRLPTHYSYLKRDFLFGLYPNTCGATLSQ